jgi:hypothetical protein
MKTIDFSHPQQLPSGNLVGANSVTVGNAYEARESIKAYYNGLMVTQSEVLKERDYTTHGHLIKEIENCKIYLKSN